MHPGCKPATRGCRRERDALRTHRRPLQWLRQGEGPPGAGLLPSGALVSLACRSLEVVGEHSGRCSRNGPSSTFTGVGRGSRRRGAAASPTRSRTPGPWSASAGRCGRRSSRSRPGTRRAPAQPPLDRLDVKLTSLASQPAPGALGRTRNRRKSFLLGTRRGGKSKRRPGARLVAGHRSRSCKRALLRTRIPGIRGSCHYGQPGASWSASVKTGGLACGATNVT